MISRIILLLVVIIFFIGEAYAHSGRTNSSGCHNNRKTGGYHCHNSGSGSSSYLPNTKAKSYSSGNYSYSKSSTVNDSKKERVKKIQVLLKSKGYNPGPADGVVGKKTTDAIMKYQVNQGLKKDGLPTYSLLTNLNEK